MAERRARRGRKRARRARRALRESDEARAVVRGQRDAARVALAEFERVATVVGEQQIGLIGALTDEVARARPVLAAVEAWYDDVDSGAGRAPEADLPLIGAVRRWLEGPRAAAETAGEPLAAPGVGTGQPVPAGGLSEAAEHMAGLLAGTEYAVWERRADAEDEWRLVEPAGTPQVPAASVFVPASNDGRVLGSPLPEGAVGANVYGVAWPAQDDAQPPTGRRKASAADTSAAGSWTITPMEELLRGPNSPASDPASARDPMQLSGTHDRIRFPLGPGQGGRTVDLNRLREVVLTDRGWDALCVLFATDWTVPAPDPAAIRGGALDEAHRRDAAMLRVQPVANTLRPGVLYAADYLDPDVSGQQWAQRWFLDPSADQAGGCGAKDPGLGPCERDAGHDDVWHQTGAGPDVVRWKRDRFGITIQQNSGTPIGDRK